jgi:hypothetical protein
MFRESTRLAQYHDEFQVGWFICVNVVHWGQAPLPFQDKEI